MSSYAINHTVPRVSGFAQPDARASSSRGTTSSDSSTPSAGPPEYEYDERFDSESTKVSALRRSVTNIFMNLKPRRGRAPSEDITASLQAAFESRPPDYDVVPEEVQDDSVPPTVMPVVSARKRAATLSTPPIRAPSFSGFSFPPRELTPDAPPEQPSRPTLSVHTSSECPARVETAKSSCKPSPSPAMSPGVPPMGARPNPVRRYVQSLRKIPARLKREEGTMLRRVDSSSIGPLQRSSSVKGGLTTKHDDVYADLMVRCATVAA